MAEKPKPPAIEIEDASQLSILAYKVRTRGSRVVDLQRFLERLNSDHARRIAEAIAAGDSATNATVSDDALKHARYFRRWADDTATNARASSRRLSPEDRKD